MVGTKLWGSNTPVMNNTHTLYTSGDGMSPLESVVLNDSNPKQHYVLANKDL